MESPAIGIGSTASISYTVPGDRQLAPVSRTTSLTHLSGDSGREVSHVPTSSRNKQASGLHGLSKAAKSDSTGSISSRVLENGQLLAASTASDKSNCVYISQGSLERTVSDVTVLENRQSSSSLHNLSKDVSVSTESISSIVLALGSRQSLAVSTASDARSVIPPALARKVSHVTTSSGSEQNKEVEKQSNSLRRSWNNIKEGFWFVVGKGFDLVRLVEPGGGVSCADSRKNTSDLEPAAAAAAVIFTAPGMSRRRAD